MLKKKKLSEFILHFVDAGYSVFATDKDPIIYYNLAKNGKYFYVATMGKDYCYICPCNATFDVNMEVAIKESVCIEDFDLSTI